MMSASWLGCSCCGKCKFRLQSCISFSFPGAFPCHRIFSDFGFLDDLKFLLKCFDTHDAAECWTSEQVVPWSVEQESYLRELLSCFSLSLTFSSYPFPCPSCQQRIVAASSDVSRASCWRSHHCTNFAQFCWEELHSVASNWTRGHSGGIHCFAVCGYTNYQLNANLKRV